MSQVIKYDTAVPSVCVYIPGSLQPTVSILPTCREPNMRPRAAASAIGWPAPSRASIRSQAPLQSWSKSCIRILTQNCEIFIGKNQISLILDCEFIYILKILDHVFK